MDDIKDNPQEVLTVADVARVLRCSKAHVCTIINGHVKGAAPIPTIAFGRRKVIRRQSLLRWTCDNEQGARIDIVA